MKRESKIMEEIQRPVRMTEDIAEVLLEFSTGCSILSIFTDVLSTFFLIAAVVFLAVGGYVYYIVCKMNARTMIVIGNRYD